MEMGNHHPANQEGVIMFKVGDLIEWRVTEKHKQTGIVQSIDDKGVLIYWFEIGRTAMAPTPMEKAIKDYKIVSRTNTPDV